MDRIEQELLEIRISLEKELLEVRKLLIPISMYFKLKMDKEFKDDN